MKTILGLIMDGRKAYHGGNMYAYVILFIKVLFSQLVLKIFENFI